MKDLLRHAETHETAAKLNIASGTAIFESGLRRLPVVTDLFRHGLTGREEHKAITRRVCELSNQSIDTRYRHPYDIAIALYIWVLDAIDQYLPQDQRLAPLAAAVVLEKGRNCSWANRIAHSVRPHTGLEQHTTKTVTRAVGASYGVFDAYSDVDEIRLHMLDVDILIDMTPGQWTLNMLQPRLAAGSVVDPHSELLTIDSDTENIQLALAA